MGATGAVDAFDANAAAIPAKVVRNFFIGSSNLFTNMTIVYGAAHNCQELSNKKTIARICQVVDLLCTLVL